MSPLLQYLRFALLATLAVLMVVINFELVMIVSFAVLLLAIPLGMVGKLLRAVVFLATGKG